MATIANRNDLNGNGSILLSKCLFAKGATQSMRTAAPLQIGRPSCLHLKIFLRSGEYAFKKQDGWEVTGMD